MYPLNKVRLVKLLFILLIVSLSHSCKKSAEEKPGFSFAFLTDIHVQPERMATEGFKAAISKVNQLKPDFVITGGDLIMDALAQSHGRADSLYNLYVEISRGFKMPVHNTMGNHEVFGYYEQSGVDSTHPLYGDKMFEDKLGRRYYVFEFNGWRFYILDSIDEWEEGGYYGYVDQEQMAWLKEDLADVDPETPIVISVHIPLISVFTQLDVGSTAPNGRGSVVTNSRELLELFKEHNLKLVLQGHLHSNEDIYVYDTQFITVGAVSGGWWQGSHRGFEEGFLMVDVSGDEIETEYIDYGWQVEE
jgi:3',5'-cyclic AMP phosphodiesterase CpdA